MTPDIYREALDELADRIRSFVAHHDRQERAAVELICTTVLLPKIAPYVEPDGFLDFERLAGDLADGLPWSSGEKRLARLACSLTGALPNGMPWEWSLSAMSDCLDDRNITAALAAITHVLTGHPAASAGGAQ